MSFHQGKLFYESKNLGWPLARCHPNDAEAVYVLLMKSTCCKNSGVRIWVLNYANGKDLVNDFSGQGTDPDNEENFS